MDCVRVRERIMRISSSSSGGRGGGGGEAKEEDDNGPELERRRVIGSSREGAKLSTYFGWTPPLGERPGAGQDGWDGRGISGGLVGEGEAEAALVVGNPAAAAEMTTDAAAVTFGAGSGGGAEAGAVIPKIPSCSRETHAVWACRAMAVGCGEQLKFMRWCFQDGEERAMAAAVSAHGKGEDPASASVEAAGGRSGGCVLEQRALSSCVLRGEEELEKRVRERERGGS